MTAKNTVTKIDIDKSAKEINGAFRKGIAQAVEGFIEAGQRLLDQKYGPLLKSGERDKTKALPHGSFLTMVETKLDFSPPTARRLMQVADHEILSNRSHASVLPASVYTLSLLANTKITETKLLTAIKDGRVNPGMEREDVKALLPKSKKAKDSDDDDGEPEDSAEGKIVARVRAFISRAGEAEYDATIDKLEDLEITQEMLTAAEEVVAAWSSVLEKLKKRLAQ